MFLFALGSHQRDGGRSRAPKFQRNYKKQESQSCLSVVLYLGSASYGSLDSHAALLCWRSSCLCLLNSVNRYLLSSSQRLTRSKRTLLHLRIRGRTLRTSKTHITTLNLCTVPHTTTSPSLILTVLQVVIGIHVLLLIFDRFPFFITAFSIFAHIVYSTNLRKFPFISLTSLQFVASCVLVLLDHFFFFRHFSHLPPPRPASYNRFSTNPTQTPAVDVPTFGQVAAFFGICVWLVPFGLFVSLSAGELTLPTMSSDGRISSEGLGETGKKAQGLVKQVYAAVGNWVQETSQAFGWTGNSGYIGGRYR